MFAIEYSNEAMRALRGVSSESRQLIASLAQGAAALAAIFPRDPRVWERLGRVAGSEVEVELDDHRVRLGIDNDRREVQVMEVSGGKPQVKRRRSTLLPPELRPARRAKLRAH